MPHIHLEYSDNLQNLQPEKVLKAINLCMFDGGYVSAASDVKSRAVAQSVYMVGLGEEPQAYLHAKVSLLSGRSNELKQQISQQILQVLQQNLPAQTGLTVQVCVEIIEMPKESYSKAVIAAH
jgi:5-carboxymethyl-2-hydroxymuconate isomerase